MMSVLVFTSKNCGYCHMLKKFLDYKHVNYEEVNLDLYPERRQEAVGLSGALTLPITLVRKQDASDRVIVGYNLAQLAPALA